MRTRFISVMFFVLYFTSACGSSDAGKTINDGSDGDDEDGSWENGFEDQEFEAPADGDLDSIQEYDEDNADVYEEWSYDFDIDSKHDDYDSDQFEDGDFESEGLSEEEYESEYEIEDEAKNEIEAELELDWEYEENSDSDEYAEPWDLYMPGLTDGYIYVAPGTFLMGAPPDQLGYNELREMQHEVTLSRAFEIKIYEVTQAEFEYVMGWNPSRFSPGGGGVVCGETCPVENISWYDSAAYLNRLSVEAELPECFIIENTVCRDDSETDDYMQCYDSEKQGIKSAAVSLNGAESIYDCVGYRFPTEAEWEYAARAGTYAAYYPTISQDGSINALDIEPNLDFIAWYKYNVNTGSGQMPHPVGLKEANAWGLYDVIGNVFEPTWDWFGELTSDEAVTDPEGYSFGAYKTGRGGSWATQASGNRISGRSGMLPSDRLNFVGIRPVRTLGKLTHWTEIPGGSFFMGCAAGDASCKNDEYPTHVVDVPDFSIMVNEVTKRDYMAVTGLNPAYFKPLNGHPDCPDCPVEMVNWYEASQFCNRIGARLPSEAEWEYAVRAGVSLAYNCGLNASCIEDAAWFDDNSDYHTHPAGLLEPNLFGLYDMTGNVWEWTMDYYHADYETDGGAPSDGSAWLIPSTISKVVRGGSYSTPVSFLRSSERDGLGLPYRYERVGFRCAR